LDKAKLLVLPAVTGDYVRIGGAKCGSGLLGPISEDNGQP